MSKKRNHDTRVSRSVDFVEVLSVKSRRGYENTRLSMDRDQTGRQAKTKLDK